MAKKYSGQQATLKDKAGSAYALSLFIFLSILIISSILSVVGYINSHHKKVTTTATIVKLDDWKFSSNYTASNPENNGDFCYYYYLCEFTDQNGTKRTGKYTDRQKIPLFSSGDYNEYIAYQSGDTLSVTYYPEDFTDGDRLYKSERENTQVILLIIFWGSTIISFFVMLSDRKEWKSL